MGSTPSPSPRSSSGSPRPGARPARAPACTSGVPWTTFLPEPRLLEVEVALDQPLDSVGAVAFVAQPERRRALRADQLAAQVRIAQPLLVDGVGRGLTAEHGDAL